MKLFSTICGLLLLNCIARGAISSDTSTHALPSAKSQLRKTQTTQAPAIKRTVKVGQGKVAFTSLLQGRQQIFVMNSDGTNQTCLSEAVAYGQYDDWAPSFSPDGKKIVFCSTRDGLTEIYRMDADGTRQTRLTNNNEDESQPCFSPDGRSIAFVSINLNDRKAEIYVMNADGTHQSRLTNTSSDKSSPSFSPDGKKLVYSLRANNTSEIWTMNIDGTHEARLVGGVNPADDPHFAPSGKTVIFTTWIHYKSRLFQIQLYGNKAPQPIPGSIGKAQACFSPDGRSIVFTSNLESYPDIGVMNLDGTGARALTSGGRNEQPSWALGSVPSPIKMATTQLLVPSLPRGSLLGKVQVGRSIDFRDIVSAISTSGNLQVLVVKDAEPSTSFRSSDFDFAGLTPLGQLEQVARVAGLVLTQIPDDENNVYLLSK